MTEPNRSTTRREFLTESGQLGVASALALHASAETRGDEPAAPQLSAAPTQDTKQKLPMRKLGNTGVDVSILGLGGGGSGRNPQIRGTAENPEIRRNAIEILHRALDLGINYFDSCCGYGASESVIGEVAASRRDEMFLATKCFRCHVPGDQLRKELDQSLKRLRTDRLDLWQIHHIGTLRQVEQIFEKDHAIDVFQKAKDEGLTRFIGITVHSSRRVIEETLMRCKFAGIEMDTLLLSFNGEQARATLRGRVFWIAAIHRRFHESRPTC